MRNWRGSIAGEEAADGGVGTWRQERNGANTAQVNLIEWTLPGCGALQSIVACVTGHLVRLRVMQEAESANQRLWWRDMHLFALGREGGHVGLVISLRATG